MLKEEWISIFIEELNKNNIFSNRMSVLDIESKLQNNIKIVKADLSGKEELGYWEPQYKTLNISKNLDIKGRDKRVLIHELIHALTTNENSVSGLVFGNNYTGITEGITEWLTNKLVPNLKYKYEYGKVSFNSKSIPYSFEEICVEQLAILFGDEMLIDAMLFNDISKIVDKVSSRPDFDKYCRIFDEINKDSYFRDMVRKTNIKELSFETQEFIENDKNEIAEKFKNAQRIFLGKFLMTEIKTVIKSQDIAKLEELKEKLKKLNELNINIEGEKDISYEKYNILFVKEYIKIVNKYKKPNEYIKFDDVEKYIKGEDNNKLILREVSFRSRVKNRLKNIFNINVEKNKVTQILRGNEESIYLKEVGKESIGGKEISLYEYLTEKQYTGKTKVLSKNIIKGNIDFKKLKKDERYRKNVGEKLLRNEAIEEAKLNYDGYIGEINENYEKNIDEEVEKRVKENIMAISLKNGPDFKYVVKTPYKKQIVGNGIYEIPCYKYLTKKELDEYRRDLDNIETSNLKTIYAEDKNILLIDELDMDRLKSDSKYKEFIEKEFLSEYRVEKCKGKYQGYLGGVKAIGKDLSVLSFPQVKEVLSDCGVKGEKKVKTPLGNFYIKSLGVDKENNTNMYEIISSDKMCKLRENVGEHKEDVEPIIVYGDINPILKDERTSYVNLCNAISKNGGYIGENEELREKYSKNTITIEDDFYSYSIWKQGKSYYIGKDMSGVDVLKRSAKIKGNLDIIKMNEDEKYNKFVRENVLKSNNLSLLSLGKLDEINIKEVDGEFCIEFNESKEIKCSIER